ncbi:T9SS type A sorting domain-containing protein [bacterium]|nr:T9SS type A sorting domain-containing protein [bacterium]
MKSTISFVLALCFVCAGALAQSPDPIVGAETSTVLGPVSDSFVPETGFMDLVGTPEQFGTTWYDYQHNGSMSRMIAYGDDGSVHCCWTNGLASGAAQRVVYYNMRNAAGAWLYGQTGVQVNTTDRCGYCTLALDLDGNAVIAYHGYNTGSTTNLIYVYNSTGEHQLPGYPVGVTDIAWPHVCVDIRGYIHVVCAKNPTGIIYYSRSENDGLTWTDWVEVANWGTGGGVSQTIAADMATGNVAIGYTRPVTTSSYDEDVYYVESTDGVTWNFALPMNITNFATGGHPMSSTCRAYSDVNLLYDSAGDLHAAYTAIPYPYQLDVGGMIWHWSQATGHRKVFGTFSENPWIAFNDPGAWHYPINRPHIAEGTDGNFYCQWGQCTTPGDVSSAGYGNWDQYVSYSEDGGYNWMAPVNVTDTHSPGAPGGQCMSENWCSTAEVVSDKIHLQYIFDLDAGGIPHTEGTWTLNPVFYQPVPIDSIMTEMVVDVTPDTAASIPPGGGTVNYTVRIENNGLWTVYFDGWVTLELPSGGTYEVLARSNLFMPAGNFLERTLAMVIPGAAPAGTYVATLGVGHYGWNVFAEDMLVFEKTGVDAAAGGEFALEGWWEVPEKSMEQIPTDHNLITCYPNPFNPVTTLSFDLPVAAEVTLDVFDISGARVGVGLAPTRKYSAGSHSIIFDGSSLASGIYFYRLTAADLNASGKMVLMK